MRIPARGIENTTRMLVMSVIILAVGGGYHCARAQPQEVVLFQEDFDDGQVQGWDLEPGWVITEGMLRGDRHSWARPTAGPWQDFRLRFRLRLQQGAIHFIYRLNDAGRYFIGFHGDGSYLKKQYWPETFIDCRSEPASGSVRGHWYDIEIAGSGSRLQFTVDGELEWEYTDPNPLIEGGFAFETLDDSMADIDDIVKINKKQAEQIAILQQQVESLKRQL